jgi:hypothetical protein
MDSVVLCYAPGDEVFARYLAEFLEANLPLVVSCSEGVVGPDLDLIEAADLALSAQVALVLLSPSSVPKVWNRKIWEPVLFDRPKEFQTFLGFVLLSECTFPALLRRERFFDASTDPLAAVRELKRCLLRPVVSRVEMPGPAPRVGPEFDEMRADLGDRPGTALEIPAEFALRFAHDCREDFEAVYRFDCRDRSRAGITGDIGSNLGLVMSGTVEENRATLERWCAGHKALFVLAGVNGEDRDFATPGGRTSVIFTTPLPVGLPGSIPNATGDAVREFQETLDIGLGWRAVKLLKVQERLAEVLEVLDAMAGTGRSRNDTDALLRIEKEQFWTRGAEGGLTPARRVPEQEEQLTLPFL